MRCRGIFLQRIWRKKTKEFGHGAVAVTDFGVVPRLYYEKTDNFKIIIFGIEAYVVDDEQNMVTRPKNTNIEEEIYVVLI